MPENRIMTRPKEKRPSYPKIKSIVDADEFKQASKELEETQSHMDYLLRFMPFQLEKGFSNDEYNAISKELRAELEELKKERAQEICETVKHAAALMNDFMREAAQIDDVMRHIDYVHMGAPLPHRIDLTTVYAGTDRTLMEAFCNAYTLNQAIFAQYTE